MRVRMPADVERDDTILANLTARQLVIIGVPALGIWAGASTLHDVVPLPILAAIAVPLLGGCVAAALVKRDGLSLDRFTVAAMQFLRAPKRRACRTRAASETVPSWISATTPPLPAPLDLPLRAIADDGTLDLGEEGTAIILSCSTVNFGLRTEQEQDALVAGFAGFVNSLADSGGVQILIRAESVHLDPVVAGLEHAAPTLPHPALEQAAREHAAFVADLAESRDLLYRQVLLVLREPNSAGRHGAATVKRRAEDAARALTGAGSRAVVLDGPAVAAVLSSAVHPTTRVPTQQGLASPEAVITSPPAEEEENSAGQAPHTTEG